MKCFQSKILVLGFKIKVKLKRCYGFSVYINWRELISITIFCVPKLCLLVRLLVLFCIPPALYTEMKTNHCDQEWQ